MDPMPNRCRQRKSSARSTRIKFFAITQIVNNRCINILLMIKINRTLTTLIHSTLTTSPDRFNAVSINLLVATENFTALRGGFFYVNDLDELGLRRKTQVCSPLRATSSCINACRNKVTPRISSDSSRPVMVLKNRSRFLV